MYSQVWLSSNCFGERKNGKFILLFFSYLNLNYSHIEYIDLTSLYHGYKDNVQISTLQKKKS